MLTREQAAEIHGRLYDCEHVTDAERKAARAWIDHVCDEEDKTREGRFGDLILAVYLGKYV